MVRRRLKSPNLTVETLYLGRQSRTNVRLCYLSDVAAPETVEAVRQKLQEASLPLVLDSGFLQAFIGKGAASLFSGRAPPSAPIPCAPSWRRAEWALWWTAAPM